MKKSTIKPLSTLVSCLTITASLGLTTLAPLLLSPAPHAIAQVNGEDDSNTKETGKDDITTIDASFLCKRTTQGWTTIVNSSLRSGDDVIFIIYESNYFRNAGYDNQKRCQMVSRRLNELFHNGELDYITSGTVNQQPVICGVVSNSETCTKHNVIFTLKSRENARELIEQFFNLKSGKGSEQPMRISTNGDTEDVPTPTHVRLSDIIRNAPSR